MPGLDPSIPLQGQTPNPMGTLSGLLQMRNTAQQYQNMQTQNQLQNLDLQRQQATFNPDVAKAQALSEQAQTQAKTSQFQLTSSQAGYARQLAAGLQSDPDFVNGNTPAMVDKLAKARQMMIDSGVPITTAEATVAPLIAGAEANPKAIVQALKNYTLQGQPVTAQSATVQPSGVPVTTNRYSQITSTNPYSSVPVGSPIPGTQAALETPPGTSFKTFQGTDGKMYQGTVDPQTGQLNNIRPLEQSAPGNNQINNPNNQQLADATAAQHEVQRIRQLVTDPMNGVQATRATTDTLFDLLNKNEAMLGKGSSGWNELAGRINTATNGALGKGAVGYAEINAYLDRLALNASNAQGLNTDSSRAMAATSVGSTDLPKDAIKEKMHFVSALNTGLDAYNKGLNAAVGTGQNQNFAAKRQFDLNWANNANPLAFRALDDIRRGDMTDYNAVKAKVKGMPLVEQHKFSQNLANINSLVTTGRDAQQ